jgi:hypothetical protein
VTIRIIPEEPNLTVITKREDQPYSVIWATNSNSEILIEGISSKICEIVVRNHSYRIYPSESEYVIITENTKR